MERRLAPFWPLLGIAITAFLSAATNFQAFGANTSHGDLYGFSAGVVSFDTGFPLGVSLLLKGLRWLIVMVLGIGIYSFLRHRVSRTLDEPG